MAIRPETAVRPSYRDGNVLRWVGAYATSTAGNSIYFLALAWAAKEVASPAEVGMVLAAGGIPRAVLMLFGGVVVDKFGPQRTVILSDATRCVIILGVAATLVLATPGLWLLILLALVFGTVDAIFMPAVGAMPPRIATADQLSRVQGMRGVAMRLGNAVGPPTAGYAMVAGGPAGAFTAAGMLFVLSFVFVVRVRTFDPPSPEKKTSAKNSLRNDVFAGLRYVRDHPILLPLLGVAALAEMAFTGPLNIGMVLLSEERGWGAMGMGLIVGAFGLGGGASGLLLTARGNVPRAGVITALSLLFSAGLITTIGSVPALWIAVATGACLGILAGVLNVVTAALIQTHASAAYLGRVVSVLTLVTVGMTPLVYPIMGAAIGVWGSAFVFAGCGVICATAAVAALCYSPLRHAELVKTSGE